MGLLPGSSVIRSSRPVTMPPRATTARDSILDVRVLANAVQAAVVLALAVPGAVAVCTWPGADAATATPGRAIASTGARLVPAEPLARDDVFPNSTVVLASDRLPTPAAGSRPRPARARTVDAPARGTAQYVLAAAYRAAVAAAPAGCHVTVFHLAGIGQVESGSVGGRTVTAGHRVVPAIYGPLLDGGPFAVVADSEGGRVDGSAQFDRAVGPLQFLPGTWSSFGADGDGDGRRDPQNVYDAALATARYLCDGGRDLALPGDLRRAILSYNQSDTYAEHVLGWVGYFREHGLAALDDVAFRVASGGRASDLVEEDDGPEAPTTATRAVSAARPAGPSAPRPTEPPTSTTTAPSTTPSTTTSPVAAPTGTEPSSAPAAGEAERPRPTTPEATSTSPARP